MINQIYPSIYLGDSSVQRIYQGDDLIYLNGTPDILLEYIDNGTAQNNPNVYFDSSVIPTTMTKFEVKFSHHTNTANTALFGSIDSEESARSRCYFYLYAGTEGNVISYKHFCIDTVGKNDDAPAVDVAHTVTLYGTGTTSSLTSLNMICDGSTYSKSYSLPGMANAQSIYMFARNKNGVADKICAANTRIYYFKIWDDNNLIRFYIPVLHYINGQYTPCFYDKVNNTYIYNLGTDDVTYKISGDYLLDWLGAPPEQSIPTTDNVRIFYDTGVVASNQLQTDIKGRVVWGRENYLFGSGTSNQTTPTWQRYGLQTMGGSTEADLMKMRANFGANTANITTYISVDASTIVGVNTLSMWYDTTRGYYCFNGTKGNTPSPVADTFSPETIYLLSIHTSASSGTVTKGTRIYYASFTTSNVPTKTYVPVLHNSQPAFLDLNSNTYIYNLGTDTPVYSFQK